MGKAGITRSLPDNQYQAAINATNPSASNPFLTQEDLDGAGIGGSVNLPLTTVLDDGNATTGIILDQDILVYLIEGIGGAMNPGDKLAYFQFIVPAGYSAGGSLDIVLTTSPDFADITTLTLTAKVNGVIDADGINAVDINTAVSYPTFEKQTYAFNTALSPGDIVTLIIEFHGQNNMDFYLRGLDFNYSINIT